ncbi:MAG TPA: hypothetical protein VGO46_07120 [Gemmatimonadaceae bacterium]|nr:hypothetical protein [Gemmatimonadaceae bacterium]
MRWVLFVVAFLVAQISNFAGMHYFALMKDQLNRDRPGGQFVWSYGFMTFGHYVHRETIRDYRAMHPEGNLYRRLRITYLVTIIAFAIAAVCLLWDTYPTLDGPR